MRRVYTNAQGNRKRIDVYSTLKNRIQFLEMKPGSVISESELAAELGVSRTPVREALLRLSNEFLVDIFPQRGTYVSRIDLYLVRETAYLRHIVETDIIMDLCKRKVDIQDDVANSMFMMQHALDKEDIEEYVVNNDVFHRAIFTFAKHEIIWNVISSALAHYIRYLMLDLEFPHFMEKSCQEHERIVVYIREGKSAELLKVLDSHHDFSTMRGEELIRQKYNQYIVQ